MLCHLEQLLLGSQLLFGHHARFGPRRSRRSRRSSPSRPFCAGGSSRAGSSFARPRYVVFPFWCPQAAHAASVRGDN
jgi:hypothetical protein